MKGNDNYKKGLWTEEEDRMLLDYIQVHGSGRWNRISNITGLKRCGKSCRLRWMNYLSPSVKRGEFTEQEDDLIIRLHKLLGNRWSLIAGRVPGRTDNQVKNHWNTHLCKRLGIKKDNRKTAAVNSHSTGTDDRPPLDGVPRRECAPASSAEESQQEQPPETAGRWADSSSFCPSYNAAEDFFNGTYHYHYNSFGDDDFWSDL